MYLLWRKRFSIGIKNGVIKAAVTIDGRGFRIEILLPTKLARRAHPCLRAITANVINIGSINDDLKQCYPRTTHAKFEQQRDDVEYQ